MAVPRRCPSICCFDSYDYGELAFDGYFACRHCGARYGRDEFIQWLKDTDETLVEWREHIASLMKEANEGLQGS